MEKDSIFTYLTWRKDLTMRQDAFRNLDALAFCCLSYVRFDALLNETSAPLSLRQVNEAYQKLHIDLQQARVENDKRILSEMAESRRYGEVKIFRYVSRFDEQQQKQFCAMSFLLETGDICIAFRGTDSTLVGWKEDFNMAFPRPLPSQRMSAVYLNQAACRIDGPFLICGHSKGGNLAVFASMWADGGVRRRIREIYSLDGPGFLPELLSEEGYREVRGRLHRILPTSSVVGMLLQNEERYEVVKSSAYGMMQHNAYTWQIEDGKLVRETDIEEKQKRMDKVLNEWIFALSEEERELFVDTFFGIIGKTGATTVFEFAQNWKNNLKICLRELRGIEPDTRKRIRQILKLLFEIYGSVMGKQEKKQT